MSEMIARTEQAIIDYDSALLDNLDLDDAVQMIISRIAKEKQRAKSAEARIAQLEAERDAFAAENEAIHRAINEMCGTDTSTVEAVQHVVAERDEARKQLEKAIQAGRDLQVSLFERKELAPLNHKEEYAILVLNRLEGKS